MPNAIEPLSLQAYSVSLPEKMEPRAAMAAQLPAWVQPLLTWITAKPAPGEESKHKPALAYVWQAVVLVVGGCGASILALSSDSISEPLSWSILGLGLLATTSGLGLFQVVVFHHCAHGTVFSTRDRNRFVGRLVSALLLFKHFDRYQAEHMLHHNTNKLFTDDDEFTDFVIGICDLAPSLGKGELWRRLLIDLISPVFHGSFLLKRIRGSLLSHEASHNRIGLVAWGSLLILGAATHTLGIILVAWIIPVTVLLQIATVFRILCEHRFPPAEIIALRGRRLVCEATTGVFPGVTPPSLRARSLVGLAVWMGWWLNMLTVQLFARVFVLVGDAPCHDFHHRRPATKRWTNYTHARQADMDAGCPGFPVNYIDTWGLFRAVDQNLAAMARCPADLLDSLS
jgi:fatty acid desaturase